MFNRATLSFAAALAFTAGCDPDHHELSAPNAPTPVDSSITGLSPAALDRARHQRLARELAIALADDQFRDRVHRAITQSPYPEHKIHLQALLSLDRSTMRDRLAQLAGTDLRQLTTDLSDAGPVEVYLPVPSHRASWSGDRNVMVATLENDAEAPVGFQLSGERISLDPQTPPNVPVIALVRAELDFARPSRVTEFKDPYDGQVVTSTTPTTPGLHLVQTRFSKTFESWLKGSPEFEVHILGQDGGTNTMRTYQCAGEHSIAPFAFDQNSTSWSGDVVLATREQLDSYYLAHPGQNFRIFVVEDDDTQCEIKMDANRASALFDGLTAFYKEMTGAKDTTTSAGAKLIKKASMFLKLFTAAASFFKTNDDPVGNAVEDVAAAGIFSGANWLVVGENTITNGALKLEMR